MRFDHKENLKSKRKKAAKENSVILNIDSKTPQEIAAYIEDNFNNVKQLKQLLTALVIKVYSK